MQGPDEMDLARLRVWARSSKLFKVHPAIAVKDSHLVVSAAMDEALVQKPKPANFSYSSCSQQRP